MIGRSFGQHEPLTTRLHNLVRSYPKGLGILKEFIQNADDAEADEIVFVIDEQQYDVAGLPDSMKWLHTTPALLVYNNRSFSESDIQGIQNIGASGKSESVGKTGRFGLGFNACYNVTDVPCFFTRGELYLFDPHLQTVPQASLESPGRCFGTDELLGEGWTLLDAYRQFVVDESEFKGTVFRLPFRTAQQASTSEIKKDVYTVSDALDAVRELREMGSAILLFLKHIRRLKVGHRNRDGSDVELLSIQATNPQEILTSRMKVNDLLSSPDPDRILTELSRRGQVYSSCRHEYSVVAEGVDHTETWRVIDGFFVDDEHQVVNACRKMIQNEEKALPYAGAAWPLDPGRQAAGRIFCFLPVPMQTNMPIQINGYFDLDDSRQNMFLDPSAQGAASYRVQWNKTLLENSVAQAYVRLLEDLRSDLGTDRIDSYYSAFPEAMVNQVGWEGWLTAAFYKQAAVAALFRVSGDTPWSVLSTTRSLPKELQSVGDALIAENFLPIPHPPLPDHIRNGFSINKIGLPKLTPDDLRIRLNEQRDVDCPIETAPRACLRKREYIKQILRFCLSDSPKKGIYGLPLVIDYRGHIRTAGLTKSPLYLMGQPWDLEVFSDHPEWFVDPSLLENLNQAETKYVGLPSMDSKCFVSELSKYIAEKAENGEPKMSTGTAGTLTDAWLQAVFSRLLESDLDKLKNEIIEIPLIPDQFHVLRPMGYASTPLLFRGHNEDLKRALAALSVPLITDVSSKLFNLLIDFSAKKGLIWQVTPCDLVDTLAASCSEAIRKYDRITDVQRAILDYLSRDESLADRKKFTERQNKLKSLRLFPTSKGDLVDLSSTTYVSQNFDSPQVDLKEVILDCGKSNQWRNLYILLGARELSRSCLIRELLLPGFEQLDDAARVKASAWLRDNLNIAQGEDETDDSDGLFDDVRNTPFIVCDDGELRAPMSVYQPESELARTVLGDQAAFPDMDTTYTKSRERWLGFFRQLKMPTEPRLSDVVKYVRKLIANTSYDHKADRFQAVYEFIKGKADAEIQAKNDVSDELSETLEELADIAWIPVRQEAGSFLCFQPAEAAFARPGDVYFRRNGQLVASQACITILKPEPNKLTCKAMGFPVKPPIALVVRHFKEVLAACSTQETMPNESVLVRVLGQIYRFFGGKAPGEVDELDEDIEYHDVDGTVDLKAIFSGIPCIWDQKNKCFWQPDHVFADNVLYMEPWRRTIWSSEDAVERGYDALGRRQSSTIEDWKQVLEEISRSDIPLSNEVADVIREAINHIVKELVNREATDGEVLVPTRNGTMLPARTVFIADAPWYESKLDSWDIPILSSSVSSIWEIHHVLNIPSLYDSIKERLREYPTESELPDKCRECSRLEDLLRSYEFILGLQRLLQHEGHYVSYSISYLHDVQVRCVKDIKTCLYLQFDGTERLLGDAKAEFYWDPETPQAMLTENRHRYFCDDLAEMLNRVLGDDGLKNLAPLIHMLQCKPSEISGVLDDLKIRKYSFNLEEEPEDEGEVTPQEFPDDDNEGMDQNEGGKTEDSKAFVSDGDEFLKDNGPEEVAAATDNSEQGGWSGQPYGVSTATSPRRPENGQPEDNSKGWPLGSVPGSSTPSGARASGSGHSIAGRSDMERAQSADVANDSSRQSTSSSHQPSAQRRLLSYVLHGNLDGYWGDTASGDDSRRLRIGEAAVEIVIDYEKRSGRKARSMAHSNPGYDVISEGDGETRYIEVKGTEVAWGERGVMLTPTQFFYARENPDRDYWLYVVEDVFSRNPQIHKIHNPSEKVDNFVFDGGWRQTVESAEGRGVKMSIPSPGDEVLQNGNVVGVVETILEAGKFPLVIYRAIDRSQQRKLLADITVRSKEKK